MMLVKDWLDSALCVGVLGPFVMMRTPVPMLAFLGHHCVWHSRPRSDSFPSYHIFNLAFCAFVVLWDDLVGFCQ